MKRERTNWILYGIVLAVVLAAEIFAVAMLWRIDMLPGKYMALLAAAMLFLWACIAVLLIPKKTKGAAARRTAALILAALTVAGCCTASVVAADIHKTMQAITRPTEVSTVISVYVLRDDPAQILKEASGYTLGITSAFDTKNTELAMQGIAQDMGKMPNTKSFETVFGMIDGLYAKQVDAVVLSDAFTLLLEDSEVYGDFAERTRVLHQVTILEKVEAPEGPTVPGNEDPGAWNVQLPEEKPNVTNTPFIIYIGGSDTRGTTLASSTRNDVNILAVVNPKTKQLLLLNTPRDYFIPNPALDGTLDKLTHCGVYGIACSVTALANLYDADIHYYGQINFTGFEKLVDAVGGVRVISHKAFYAGSVYVREGENYFNGKQALAFARERHALGGGDNDRGKNQMKIITAIVEKMASGAIIANYAEILESLQGMFNTNISMDEISALVKMQLSDMEAWNIQSYAVSGWGGSEITGSMPGFKAYVTYPDQATVDHASELIERVFAGEILTQADMEIN